MLREKEAGMEEVVLGGRSGVVCGSDQYRRRDTVPRRLARRAFLHGVQWKDVVYSLLARSPEGIDVNGTHIR